MEFSHDPLFRKATAKFDERGAKGLTQNVSKLSNKGLEILFYTGALESEAGESKAVLNPPSISSVSCFRQTTFEDLAQRKLNDSMVNYKHTRLNIPYPSSDLSLSPVTFTQSSAREEAEPTTVEVGEDDEWLAKLNSEKVDEEFSLLGAQGTQDSIQAYDVTLSAT